MSAANNYAQWKERLALAWMARTEQERKYLAIGAAVAALALVYGLFIAPALAARSRLEKELPILRTENAQLRAMANADSVTSLEDVFLTLVDARAEPEALKWI